MKICVWTNRKQKNKFETDADDTGVISIFHDIINNHVLTPPQDPASPPSSIVQCDIGILLFIGLQKKKPLIHFEI